MAGKYFTSQGVAVEVGRELGRGGEGSVFEVQRSDRQVAKLYHKLPDAKKQAKLTFMASAVDDKLLDYVAWPQETLHSSRGGPVVGFLMPKVVGKEPVHMVYSPARRRQDHPKAAWDFLVFVARNIAASFETIHGHGHVVGDVNQNSFMVGGDSKVVLIDSDSFQVNAKGTLHLCEVGVSHFTPPELQSLKSFDGFTRSSNHDNFGLALLLFHVLFGGRHPFSGVPLRDGVGDALETDIKHFRYAYARDGQARGLKPPPRSIPVSMLPGPVESMFHAAFTEQGASGGRPTARQWVAALDEIRGKLKRCGASSMHVYPDHLGACPWCALEQQGVVYFVDLGAVIAPTGSGFALAQVWAMIEQIPAPSKPVPPRPQDYSVQPTPLPAALPKQSSTNHYRILVVVLAVAFIVAAPKAWLLILLAAGVGWAVAGRPEHDEFGEERQQRQSALHRAQSEYNLAVGQLEHCGPGAFLQKKKVLVDLRHDYEQFLPGGREAQTEAAELSKLQDTARQRQLQQFLERHFIDQANIKDVGPTRKAALRSFGIETAADVETGRVRMVKGFGQRLTSAMVDWRKSCERRFTFDPARAVSDNDRMQVRSRFLARRAALEAKILAGIPELQRASKEAATKASSAMGVAEAAARALAQAQADLKVF